MGDDLFSLRVLPTRPGQGHLLHALLEAHDHLACAIDREDGSIEIVGPRELAAEIEAVVAEITRATGAWLPVNRSS